MLQEEEAARFPLQDPDLLEVVALEVMALTIQMLPILAAGPPNPMEWMALAVAGVVELMTILIQLEVIVGEVAMVEMDLWP